MSTTFHVYYFGLLCHIGPGTSKKTRVAIVRDVEHIPLIVFDDGSYKLLDGTDHVLFYALKADGTATPLKGTPETDRLFEAYVPSLKTIMGGRLKNDVGTQEKAVDAIIADYPGQGSDDGTLSVYDLYDYKGLYEVNGSERWNDCVARLTGLHVPIETVAIQVRVKTGGDERTVRNVNPDACILIGNISEDVRPLLDQLFNAELPKKASATTETASSAHVHGANDSESSHVQKYGAILDNEYQVSVTETEKCEDHVTGPACDWVMDIIELLIEHGIFTSIHIECSNTNWP